MLTNPVAPFYEFILAFFIGMPIAFRAFAYWIWGLTVVFAIIHIFIEYTK